MAIETDVVVVVVAIVVEIGVVVVVEAVVGIGVGVVVEVELVGMQPIVILTGLVKWLILVKDYLISHLSCFNFDL